MTDRDRETAREIAGVCEKSAVVSDCSGSQRQCDRCVTARLIAAALRAAREEWAVANLAQISQALAKERERLAEIVPGSICDVIGDCVCPEDFRNPDCAPCAVAAAIRALGGAA